MILFIATILFLVIVFILYKREHQFLKKNTKDVINDDMKKYLNLPTAGDQFEKQFGQSSQKKQYSKKLLKEMNQHKK